jgi:thymidylate synthase (FAD)
LEDGKKIKTTKDHKFITPEGFETLENIIGLQVVGNRAVMTKQNRKIGTNGIPLYQNKQWLTERKQESLFLGGGLRWISEKYCINYNTLRKWMRIHGLQYTKKETAKTVDIWNKGKFGYKRTPHSYETRKKMSAAAKSRGVNHNWYRGGNSHKREHLNETDAKNFRNSKNHTCERCGKYGGRLDIHHIVPVSVNPSLLHEQNNWELLCRECHVEHHKGEDMTGWQNLGAKTRKSNAYTVKWTSIKSIEYIGEEQTYDIEVDHDSHNYIANGIVTHNSQRYADPTKDLDFEIREARLQDVKNRQNSVETEDFVLKELWENKQNEILDLVKETYKWAIDHGIAKEQARAILPEGLTLSRMYMNGTLRSWVHYIELRSENGTQKEHIEIALECAKVISQIFPIKNIKGDSK